MKVTLNREMFTTSTFDSGSLGVLASVVHQFTAPGRYRAVVQRHAAVVGTTFFEVSETAGLQLDVDLAAVHRAGPATAADCGCDPARAGSALLPAVSPQGYVLFFASSGGGYSVAVGPDTERGPVAFDSQNLGAGDLFALSLLEPTVYTMVNRHGGAPGEIVVVFSAERARGLQNLEPQYVDVSRAGFQPSRLQVSSAQGIVFRVQAAARIVVEKRDPEKARPEPRRPVRFTRLRPPEPPRRRGRA